MRIFHDLVIGKGRRFLIICLLVLTGLSVIGFSFDIYTSEMNSAKMEDFDHALQNLKAAMRTDSIRQFQIKKIIRIIERFNPKLDAKLKYEIADEIYMMSLKYEHIDVDLICATITHESALSWRPEVTSEAGAMGLMQIMPATGVLLAKDEGIPWSTPDEVLFNPINNIRLGCRYLNALIRSYDTDGGLAAYNGGEKRAAMWIANNRDFSILWEETRGYIPAVLKLYEEYKNQGVL